MTLTFATRTLASMMINIFATATGLRDRKVGQVSSTEFVAHAQDVQFRKDTEGGIIAQALSNTDFLEALFDAHCAPHLKILVKLKTKVHVNLTSVQSARIANKFTASNPRRVTRTGRQFNQHESQTSIFQFLNCESADRLGRGLCFEDADSLVNGITPPSRTVCNLRTKWKQSNIEDIGRNPLHRPRADPLGVCNFFLFLVSHNPYSQRCDWPACETSLRTNTSNGHLFRCLTARWYCSMMRTTLCGESAATTHSAKHEQLARNAIGHELATSCHVC